MNFVVTAADSSKLSDAMLVVFQPNGAFNIAIDTQKRLAVLFSNYYNLAYLVLEENGENDYEVILPNTGKVDSISHFAFTGKNSQVVTHDCEKEVLWTCDRTIDSFKVNSQTFTTSNGVRTTDTIAY